MALQIVRNNIINVSADAIVNTANPAVAVGAGVDCAIYRAAGWDKLLADRKKIGEMKPGEVAYTPAYDLDAKYIIHAIGPAWMGGGYGERETVALCYSRSLELAKELGCESIAFPLMATGTYGFPKDEALRIAIREISAFLLTNEMDVLLVVYDKESFEVSGRLFTDIRSFIEDSEVEADLYSNIDELEAEKMMNRSSGAYGSMPMDERSVVRERRRRAPIRRQLEEESIESEAKAMPNMSFPSQEESLDEWLQHLDKTFQEYLFMLIDRKGLEDTEVYKKANLDRKHFSKIRSNKDYSPSKKTALALAIALELSLDETKDLLRRAGIALSPSNMFDRIVEYCIDNGEYDIYEINCVLFKYDQPTLGA